MTRPEEKEEETDDDDLEEDSEDFLRTLHPRDQEMIVDDDEEVTFNNQNQGTYFFLFLKALWYTVFENRRKSLIQHCERSELQGVPASLERANWAQQS